MYFLKAEKQKNGEVRVRVYAELENGYVGRAEQSIKQVKPHKWTAFCDALEAFGKEKAEAVALEQGEFRVPEAPRDLALVERDLQAASDTLKQLEIERQLVLKNSVQVIEVATQEVVEEEEVEDVKKVKKSKKGKKGEKDEDAE